MCAPLVGPHSAQHKCSQRCFEQVVSCSAQAAYCIIDAWWLSLFYRFGYTWINFVQTYPMAIHLCPRHEIHRHRTSLRRAQKHQPYEQ